MSDDIPDLAALRGARQASDAEYIEQLEQLSLGQEREVRRLRAVVDAVRPYMVTLPVDVAEGIIGIEPIDHVDQERARMRAALGDISKVVMPDVGHGGNYGFVVAATEAMAADRDRLGDVVNDLTVQKAILVGAKAQEAERADQAEAENARLRAVADVALDLADAACEHDEARLADGWVRLQAAFVAAGLVEASEEGT